MSGDLGPWPDQKAKPPTTPDADAAIRGFCQDDPFVQAWENARCQNHVSAALAPYLAVPRVDPAASVAECRLSLSEVRPVRTEVEILRERVAAMEAQIAALTPPPSDPVPHPMTRAVSRWPGSQPFIQGIRWRGV